MTDEYAIIGIPKYEPIPDAKTLKRAWFEGLSYAVSVDLPEDKPVVIFTPDGQISEEYAEANDCVERRDPNTGLRAGGFFGKNRKVRTIALMRGKVKSAGYIAPLESLAFTGYDVSILKPGDVVDVLNGILVAQKFLAKKHYQGASQPREKTSLQGIPEHPDTKQLMRYLSDIPKGATLTLTLKMHGTSARVANAFKSIPDDMTSQLVLQFARNHLPGLAFYYTQEVVGTRRVIIQNDNNGYYGAHSPWLDTLESLKGKLIPGECLYGELVGYVASGSPIQRTGGVVFDYGLPDGQHKFYVYNIKMTHPGGWAFDMPWGYIKARCSELGLDTVPELKYLWANPETRYRITTTWVGPNFIYDGNQTKLTELVTTFVDGTDPLGNHIREGVCVRAEHEGQTKFYKFKSQTFYELEDKSKNAGEIDLEELNNETA